MNRKEKRRARDVERTVERLHFKFLTKYVEVMHNDIYNKAQELFEYVRRKNPEVKDLTKTTEFMKAVMPNEQIPRHYNRANRGKRLKCDTPPPQRCMVLNIPLMAPPTNAAQSSPPSQSLPPSQSSPSSLVLPTDVYNTLLDDLRQDPELWRILNDFPLNDYVVGDMDGFTASDMNDLVAADMGDTFMVDDLTPLEEQLEIELEGVFENIS